MSTANTPRTRRYALQACAAAGGSVLFVGATRTGSILNAFAHDSYDDASGHGHGRGRGRGGDDDQRLDDDDSQVVAQMAQIPEGAVQIRIISDDAGGFVPGAVTVDLGQTIAFVNSHSDEHTATGSGFDTGIIPPGGVATVVLEEPGLFRYACQIHPEMTGEIAVRDANGVVPSQTTPSQAMPSQAQMADTAQVRIANFAFDPSTITVPAGSTVTWSNQDGVAHTVTAVDGGFDSGVLDPGVSFSWTFSSPGSFAYQCQIHPSMQGSVVVE